LRISRCSAAKTSAFFHALLDDHRDELRVTELEIATFVCVTSIEALPHNAVLHDADMLGDEAVEALVDEATRLVVGYLQRRAG
jgi:hypothetical protein